MFRGICRRLENGSIILFFPGEDFKSENSGPIKEKETYPCQITWISGIPEIIVKTDMPVSKSTLKDVEDWLGFKLPKQNET